LKTASHKRARQISEELSEFYCYNSGITISTRRYRLFNLLAEQKKVWTKDAALIVVVISRKNFEHNEKYSITHQYDAGAAWENLALEASSRGLVAHGMAGFDYVKARIDLEVPDNFDVMAMIAIGKKGPKDNLPQQLQEREYPNDRKPLKDIVMEGQYKK
jgi:nitroreductase